MIVEREEYPIALKTRQIRRIMPIIKKEKELIFQV
jgi:hypothetical protein